MRGRACDIMNGKIDKADRPNAKRRRLTLGQRAEIVCLLRSRHSAAQIMHMYEVSRRTVTNITAASDDIIKQASNSGSLNISSRRAPKFPSIDERVYAFITVVCAHKMLVTVGVIQQKALMIKDDMLLGSSSEIQSETLLRFTA